MRGVVQRVTQARVSVSGETVGEIDGGLCVLVGVGRGDDASAAKWLAEKVAGLRIFEDDAGKMNRSLLDTGGALLAISQFTLFGDARKGKRPSFTAAMEPTAANELFEAFCAHGRQLGLRVETGRFGADMLVEIHNDGPVTILLDSTKQF